MDLMYIIKVCNDNDGFIMGLLTFVYVVATIFICIFNYKSAKSASNQIEASNLIQKQNVDMQLFEMRKKLIHDLEEALVIKVQHFTKILFENDKKDKYEEKVILLLNEIPYLFQKDDFEYVYHANDCLNEIQEYLNKYNSQNSEFGYVYFKDGYEEKMKKFNEMTRNFFDNVIDENSYKNLAETVDAEDMCECMIEAKRKYLEAMALLDENDLQVIFKTKYLSFK